MLLLSRMSRFAVFAYFMICLNFPILCVWAHIKYVHELIVCCGTENPTLIALSSSRDYSTAVCTAASDKTDKTKPTIKARNMPTPTMVKWVFFGIPHLLDLSYWLSFSHHPKDVVVAAAPRVALFPKPIIPASSPIIQCKATPSNAHTIGWGAKRISELRAENISSVPRTFWSLSLVPADLLPWGESSWRLRAYCPWLVH